jgi:hypothetical protein
MLLETLPIEQNQHSLRVDVLRNFGASSLEVEELLRYNENIFHPNGATYPVELTLAPEPHIAAWEEYAIASQTVGVFEELSTRLVQFQFPIQEDISKSEAYRAATRSGLAVDGIKEATGLILKQPEKLQLIIHQSFAGSIPVLLAGNREDFVSLVQALTKRNEPQPIPESMGACIVKGFNNWDRIRQYRQQWEAKNPGNCSESN